MFRSGCWCYFAIVPNDRGRSYSSAEGQQLNWHTVHHWWKRWQRGVDPATTKILSQASLRDSEWNSDGAREGLGLLQRSWIPRHEDFELGRCWDCQHGAATIQGISHAWLHPGRLTNPLHRVVPKTFWAEGRVSLSASLRQSHVFPSSSGSQRTPGSNTSQHQSLADFA